MELKYAEIIDNFVIMCYRLRVRDDVFKYHYQAVSIGRIDDVVIADDYVDAKTAYETLLLDEPED